jgi:hypothetical protein
LFQGIAGQTVTQWPQEAQLDFRMGELGATKPARFEKSDPYAPSGQ